MVEWVEVRGKSVDVAVAAAMSELGVTSRDGVDVEVVQEPERGFLGLGGRDAVVRVKPRSPDRGRRRRGRADGRDNRADRNAQPDRGDTRSDSRSRGGGQAGSTGSSGGGRTQRNGGRQATSSGDSRARGPASARPGQRPSGGPRSEPRGRDRAGIRDGADRNTSRRGGGRQDSGNRNFGSRTGDSARREERPRGDVDPNQQAPAVEEFLIGLVHAFGLEGEVAVSIEEEVVVASITGEQTEALVGPRGSVMEAVHEITKTVLHRQFNDTARVRIDIAGYGERRRQALSIYAQQLIDQVLGEGGEIMLEPMSAADRKVIHDAVGTREGVQSYSEGEPPRRYVVIAVTDAAVGTASTTEGPVESEIEAALTTDEPESED